MPEITDDFVNDIFNIPRDGSNISDEENDVQPGQAEADAKVPFEEKASELVNEIASLPPAPQLKIPEKPVAEAPKPPTVDAAIKQIQQSRPDLFKDDKPDPVAAAVSPQVTLPVEPIVVSVDMKDIENLADIVAEGVKAQIEKETLDIDFDKEVEQIRAQQKTVLPDLVPQMEAAPPQQHSSARWKLTSPSPKYRKFYEEKRFLLSNYLLSGGEIPFDQYYKELGEASVDIDVPTWDTEEVGRRITQVQKWRDRVKAIQMHVNKQYFAWDRFIDLLPGVLARIEYERGEAKRDGLTYEHMSDFEGYFGSLEGLHNSCTAVSKHLDAAYNSLSRTAAIVQPVQEVERWTPGNGARQMSASQQKYDGLQTNANRPGGVTGQSKEAGRKPAEPTSGWDTVL